MDDIMGKLGELLSDKESVKQISELAQMMMNGTAEDDSEEENTSSEGLPDLSAVMKLSELAGALRNSDTNTELLTALKPHLREERQRKVDKAIKLLKLLAVWNLAKENGLLSELL